ncbi:MAG: TRAP transporter small permease subunit [Gammaproteobacteria bacterium]|nr:TRAP transporter small permease subunit [Gammaproteobacteria bacterium]
MDVFVHRFHQFLWALTVLVALSIAAIAVLIPVNLVLVKMQWGNLWWLHEAVEYLLYAGVFLCAPWVLSQDEHVRVDVLTSALSWHAAVRLKQLVDVVCAALCVLLCLYGVRMAISEFQDGTLPDKDLRIQTGYMMVIFAASFALLAIEFLLRWRRAKALVTSGRRQPAGSSL